MNMNDIKKILCIIGAIVVIVAAVIAFVGNDLEHIEDTNGADNYSLQKITDEDIINLNLGTKGSFNERTGFVSETVEYSADKFTGVMELYDEYVIANQLDITVNHAQVTSGNFRIVLLVNDEIVHDFTLNELTQTYTLENVSGYVSLRVAGESAAFMFDYYIV